MLIRFKLTSSGEQGPPTQFILFLLAEQISVEEADQGVETDEDDEVDPRGFVHTAPPHEQQPEKSSKLSSIEDVLYVGDRHAIWTRVRTRL